MSLLENGSLSLLIMVNVSIGLATAVPVNRNVYKIYIRAGTDVLDIEVPLAAAIENAYIDGDYWRSVKRPRTSSYMTYMYRVSMLLHVARARIRKGKILKNNYR